MSFENVRNRNQRENLPEEPGHLLFSNNRHRTNEVEKAGGCTISNGDIARNMIKSEKKCNHFKQYLRGGLIGAFVTSSLMTYYIFYPSQSLLLFYHFVKDNFVTSTSMNLRQ